MVGHHSQAFPWKHFRACSREGYAAAEMEESRTSGHAINLVTCVHRGVISRAFREKTDMKNKQIALLVIFIAIFAISGTLAVQNLKKSSTKNDSPPIPQKALTPTQIAAQAALNKDLDAYMKLIGGTAEQQLKPATAEQNESGWQWKLQHKEEFRMKPKEKFTVWEVPPQAGRDSGTLVRVVLEADFPVHVAFMDRGKEASDITGYWNTCPIASVLRIDAICNVRYNDANRVFVIQDSNEAFIASGEDDLHGESNIHIAIFEYSFTP
jgi:hypothetical protein